MAKAKKKKSAAKSTGKKTTTTTRAATEWIPSTSVIASLVGAGVIGGLLASKSIRTFLVDQFNTLTERNEETTEEVESTTPNVRAVESAMA